MGASPLGSVASSVEGINVMNHIITFNEVLPALSRLERHRASQGSSVPDVYGRGAFPVSRLSWPQFWLFRFPKQECLLELPELYQDSLFLPRQCRHFHPG